MTASVSSGQGFGRYSGIVSTKETTSQSWDLNVTNKTMWSNPHIKLVNSNGASRSNELRGTVGTQVGSGNECINKALINVCKEESYGFTAYKKENKFKNTININLSIIDSRCY